MRSDLLQRIGAHKDLENVIVLTHNFDGVFLESVVLPALRKSGNPAITVFAEASCAIEAYESQRQLLSGLGLRYRLVPVELTHPFRFHPKAVFLAGPDQATLFVGSGNLGFGGWRENGEVWAAYSLDDAEQSEAPAFAYFRDYLFQVLDKIPISESVRHDIGEAFGPERKRWVAYLDEPGLLLGRVGHGPSLIELLETQVMNKEAAKLWVCAPYFDEQGQALRKLGDRFSAKETIVLLQEKQTNLPIEAIAGLPASFSLKSLSFKSQDEGAPRFVHAKFYGIDHGDKVKAIFGSANCSDAAWFISGIGGNAELLATRDMPTEEFERTFLDDLEISNRPPELQAKSTEEKEEYVAAYPQIRILAARFMNLDGIVRVGFKKEEDVRIIECLINEQPHEFHEKGKNELAVISLARPISIGLRGVSPDGEVASNRIWVDHEFELSASSKERSLVDTIHQSVKDGIWGLAAWIDIMKLLQGHLEYLAPRGIAKIKKAGVRGAVSPTVRFTRADVFSGEFGLLGGSKISLWETSQSRLDGLRQLLLRWFGFGWGVEEAGPGDHDNEPEPDETDGIPPTKPTVSTKKTEHSKASDQQIVKKERDRAAALVKKVVNKISEAEYLEKRPPELISKDFGIIAILMTSALAEEWLSENDYFEATHRVWRQAFLDDSEILAEPKGQVCGYLERLYREADDSDRVLEAFATIDFAGALAAWALATEKQVVSPERALLSLSQVMAVARLPWIWRADAVEALRDQIRRLLVHTGLLRLNDDKGWAYYCKRWDELIKTGYAMREFEEIFKDSKIYELKKMVKRNKLKRGELLWQTSQGGFYILKEDTQRDIEKNVEVLKLRSREPVKMIKSNFLIPLHDVLDHVECEEKFKLSEEVPATIKNYITTIIAGLAYTEASHIQGLSAQL